MISQLILESKHKVSLTVLSNGEAVFQKFQQWLLPLFDLEDDLKQLAVGLK